MRQYLLAIGVQGVGALLGVGLNVVLARLLGVVQYGLYVTLLSVVLILGTLASGGANKLLTRELARNITAPPQWARALARWALRRVGQGAIAGTLAYLVWLLFLQSEFIALAQFWLAAFAGSFLILLLAFCLAIAGAINGLMAPQRSRALVLIVRNGGVLVLVGVMYFWIQGPYTALQALWLQVCGFVLAGAVGTWWLISLSRETAPAAHQAQTYFTQPSVFTKEWDTAARHFLILSAATVLINRLDTVLVHGLAGPEVAGLYTAGARLGQVAMMVALAINAVMQSRIARAYGAGDSIMVRNYLLHVTMFTLPLAIAEVAVAVVFAPQIVGVFGVNYAHSAAPFTWAVVAYACVTAMMPLYSLLTMVGAERFVALISWLVLAINISLVIVLTPAYGAAGAGVAMAAAYGVMMVSLVGYAFINRSQLMLVDETSR